MNTLRWIVTAGTAVMLTGWIGCGARDNAKLLDDGIAALQRGRFGHAERLLARAVRQYPDDPGIWAHLAEAQWNNGNVTEAVASMRQGFEQSPEHPRIRKYFGLLLLAAEENHEALPLLEMAVSAEPHNAEVLTALGVIHLRLGDNARAVDLMMTALERDRDYAPALYNMAVYHRDQRRDVDQALNFFERYLELSPPGERVAEVRRAVRNLQRERSATVTRPGEGLRSPFESSSPRLMSRAQAAIQRGDLDEAYIHLRTAIRNDENDAHALWTMAEFTEIHLQSPQRAMQVWQDFVNRFPDDPRAGDARQRLRRLAADNIAAGDAAIEDAVADDRLALGARTINLNPQARRNPDAARRAFERGLQYQSENDWDRAIYFFRRAFEQDDSLVTALLQLARAYENSNDLPMAIDVYGYALRRHPELVEARVAAARILIRQDERNLAISQLRAVLRQRPRNADAHLLLGVLLRDEPGEREAARRHLMQYLEYGPPGEISNRVRHWLDTWEG